MAGLQCWDASGNLIVDLGDYMLRHVARVQFNQVAGAVSQVNIPVAGVTATGSFAVFTPPYGDRQSIVSCYDGGVTINFAFGFSPASGPVDIYSFI
ncbi:hypothetical protein SMY84_001768 [Cronobacter turicensis]|nr:hypothetical protein [Cronobacter turicensis]